MNPVGDSTHGATLPSSARRGHLVISPTPLGAASSTDDTVQKLVNSQDVQHRAHPLTKAATEVFSEIEKTHPLPHASSQVQPSQSNRHNGELSKLMTLKPLVLQAQHSCLLVSKKSTVAGLDETITPIVEGSIAVIAEVNNKSPNESSPALEAASPEDMPPASINIATKVSESSHLSSVWATLPEEWIVNPSDWKEEGAMAVAVPLQLREPWGTIWVRKGFSGKAILPKGEWEVIWWWSIEGDGRLLHQYKKLPVYRSDPVFKYHEGDGVMAVAVPLHLPTPLGTIWVKRATGGEEIMHGAKVTWWSSMDGNQETCWACKQIQDNERSHKQPEELDDDLWTTTEIIPVTANTIVRPFPPQKAPPPPAKKPMPRPVNESRPLSSPNLPPSVCVPVEDYTPRSFKAGVPAAILVLEQDQETCEQIALKEKGIVPPREPLLVQQPELELKMNSIIQKKVIYSQTEGGALASKVSEDIF